ncbi:coproporphyrinogen-III oxidase family protein [Crassaminicella profunda]|uniref:coproporphyrinogen-III oxidase family protein n=1 Tax=Crassaminicella profunda TaxID=1286698 RepID=UPI001CA60B9B|nr:coproporphyrinogen-III oxidase family protein [Crassaminicella profunda]QZY55850.1 coproporphyrinogen III oxidase family protein [Crassaminicella profunda]
MVTNLLRRMILKKKEKFLFKRYEEGNIDFDSMNNEIGIYIHIPFCKSICPYCPYNKVLYEKNKAQEYKEALIKEIHLYKEKLQGKKITSIYIGGGTPTLLIKELEDILDVVKDNYDFHGDIGIEIYPTAVNEELLSKLKEMKINLISLGVQTFDDEKLKFLGRAYTENEIHKAITLIKSFEFQCVDIDIMTNIPGQTYKDIQRDLEKVYAYEIDQLSIYPLIVFPMTHLSRRIKQKGLTRFNEWEEKKILQMIDTISKDYGYERTSIWTYGKKTKNRYTSVTRESFVGFGGGASSHFGNYFYMNTFNIDAYISALEEERLPINIVNTMTDRETMIFWLFWRCYDGEIHQKRFYELFGKDMKKEFQLLFIVLKLFSLGKEKNGKVILTDLGRFIYHYVEKQYSIHYLNYLWQRSMEEAWIEEIKI